MAYCRGICTRYEFHKAMRGSAYEVGKRRCQICGLFLEFTINLRCPCCNYLTRGAPHCRTPASKKRKLERTAYPEAIKYSLTHSLNIENLRT